MATGLLIILVGKATRVSQYLTSLDKEYEGTIELGKVTDTQDADGDGVADVIDNCPFTWNPAQATSAEGTEGLACSGTNRRAEAE
jgi:tRNA pseudouridine55 synthase